MRIIISAKTNSKVPKIKEISDGCLSVYVREKPKDGEANRAILEAVADYYGIAKSNISFISGLTSKNKILEII